MHIGDVDIKALKSARLLGITLDEKSTLSNVLKIIVTLRIATSIFVLETKAASDKLSCSTYKKSVLLDLLLSIFDLDPFPKNILDVH